MNVPIVAVIGGSSPFTAGLVNAFAQDHRSFDKVLLRLHGRCLSSLNLVSEYAESKLRRYGWEIEQTDRLTALLDHADIVIHQARYGGLTLRHCAEQLCNELGVHADETMGPAALATAIRSLDDVRLTCDTINDCCPNAVVINLTNPLSAVTHAMTRFGVKTCIGLCELPLYTKKLAANLSEVPDDKVEWTYTGLNHRGFIDTLQYGSRNLLHELPDRLHHQTLNGISRDAILQINAIPLKYFQLIVEPPKLSCNRANILSMLRDRVESELLKSRQFSPPSLSKRYMEWYPLAVVPVVAALCRSDSTVHVVNIARDDGIVVETFAEVSMRQILPRPYSSKNPHVHHWNQMFQRHEQSFLNAMYSPTRRMIMEAFDYDLIVPPDKVVESTDKVLRFLAT